MTYSLDNIFSFDLVILKWLELSICSKWMLNLHQSYLLGSPHSCLFSNFFIGTFISWFDLNSFITFSIQQMFIPLLFCKDAIHYWDFETEFCLHYSTRLTYFLLYLGCLVKSFLNFLKLFSDSQRKMILVLILKFTLWRMTWEDVVIFFECLNIYTMLKCIEIKYLRLMWFINVQHTVGISKVVGSFCKEDVALGSW